MTYPFAIMILLKPLEVTTRYFAIINFFPMKITETVTKSLHQDHGLCCLQLLFFLTHKLSYSAGKLKSYDRCFPQQIRIQTTVR